MLREIIKTKDGSDTILIPSQKITYHSIYGAVQESKHVFIEAGLNYFLENNKEHICPSIKIFEMGFGTGLNALLTLQEAIQHQHKIFYQTIELFPLNENEISLLSYNDIFFDDKYFHQLHHCDWEKDIAIYPLFIFHKIKNSFLNYSTNQLFNIIYYDAFAPEDQPELWTEEIFAKLFSMLLPKGVLVTYCSKGNVRRALLAAGFSVEKIPGPPHKREMIRARKLIGIR